jgi:hypothetical protein
MDAVDRILESIGLIRLVKSDDPDIVDTLKLVKDDNGVECLISQESCDYQENHEGSEDETNS